MRYFLLEDEHLARFEEFRRLEPARHAFLQKSAPSEFQPLLGDWFKGVNS